MASGQTSAKEVMLSWKHSSGHYRNLLNKDYQCGAIARYKDTWCAVFYDGSPENLSKKKQDVADIVVTIKRQDKAGGKYIGGATILVIMRKTTVEYKQTDHGRRIWKTDCLGIW